MMDLEVEVHVFTQQLKTQIEEVLHDYLCSEDYKDDIGVTQAHDFEFAKRRFKKFYIDLALSPLNLQDCTSVVVKYDECDDNLSTKKGKSLSGVTLQTSIDVEIRPSPN